MKNIDPIVSRAFARVCQEILGVPANEALATYRVSYAEDPQVEGSVAFEIQTLPADLDAEQETFWLVVTTSGDVIEADDAAPTSGGKPLTWWPYKA